MPIPERYRASAKALKSTRAMIAPSTVLICTACASDGESTDLQIVTTSSDFKRALIDADECVLDSWVVSGQVERVASNTEVESLKFLEFDVDVDNRKVSVSSALYEFNNGHPFSTRSWKGTSYSVEEGGRLTTVRELELENIDIYGISLDKRLSMNFIARGPWTNDRPLKVSTPVPFGGLTSSETGRDYTTGKLVLESDEGNRLTLDVDSGEPDLVLITLERDGVVTTHSRPLPDALR